MAVERRSNCPISFSLDLLGDRWTLLVVRDLALKGRHTFSELQAGGEGIATNILSDRLARLETAGLIEKRRMASDRRRFFYTLTVSGRALMPVLLELIVWGAEHDQETDAPSSFVRAVKRDRASVLKKLLASLDDRERHFTEA